jgi:ATP synthase protein I
MARPCPAARLCETFVKSACGCGECDGMPPSTDPFYAGLGQALRMGTELLAALIVGGGLGWLADTYLFASAPWGVVTGLVLGAVAGVLNAYRAAQRWK